MRKWLAGILIVTTFYACKEQSVYEGFSVTNTGLNYKIYSIGEPSQIIHDSDVVELKFYVYSLSDSLLFKGLRTVIYKTDSENNLNEFLGLLALGDSASAIIPIDSIRHLTVVEDADKMVKVNFIPVLITPYYEWAFYTRYPELVKDLELEEQLAIHRYLQASNKDSIQFFRGVFIIKKVAGSGDKFVTGDEITMNYTVKDMNGRLIDSTINRKEPFSYTLGELDQVLEGFDIGVREMRLGEKAEVIVPSKRGFGEGGSSTGLVGGYQSLIFSVEIIKVSRKKD
jgi:peptidylprolyl isomerase